MRAFTLSPVAVKSPEQVPSCERLCPSEMAVPDDVPPRSGSLPLIGVFEMVVRPPKTNRLVPAGLVAWLSTSETLLRVVKAAVWMPLPPPSAAWVF